MTRVVVYVLSFWFLANVRESFQEKLNLDALNNYSEFLNYGDGKLHKIKGGDHLENAIFKSKLDVLGELFKKNVDFFKVSQQLDIAFLVDASSSVGSSNFRSELKFIKKLLSDITVDYNHTRVAVVTFSSPSNTIKNIDDISDPSLEHNKCLLLNDQLMNIEYKGGETDTIGAFRKAKEIFHASHRNRSKKVVFLITDGYSSGENPVPLSEELKNDQITIFTIGIRNGNFKELYELSSSPGEFYSYLLDSFEEFESLARRALHVDLSGGEYIPLGISKPCDKLCEFGNCCDENALCTCGTTTGHYSCICQPGFYGSGLRNSCLPCIPGTYSDGPNLCLPCPDVHHTTVPPAQGIESCICKKGFQADGYGGCQVLKCPKIKAPEHGYIVKKKECSNVLNSACGLRCEVGYTLVGSSIRLCQENATWSGSDPTCEVKTCKKLPIPKFGSVKCEQTDLGVVYDRTEKKLPVDTQCNFECEKGNLLIGSTQRTCLPISQWDGLRTICKQIKCNKLPHVKYGRIEPPSCTSGKQEFGKPCKIVCNEGFKAEGPTDKTCGNHGLWGKKHEEETLCVDVTSPDLVCPSNLTGLTLPGTNYGQVFWQEPNVTGTYQVSSPLALDLDVKVKGGDNSGLEVSLWVKPGIVNVTDYKFTIGTTPVTYFAQDAFNNAIKCKFFVQILDEEPPTIEGCIDPPAFLVGGQSKENITWDEPNVFDNSQNVSVTKSHRFGVFDIGTTLVTYTAKDPSGNVNVCKINITVEESHCPNFIPPLNGKSECQDQADGVQCVITCQEGYAIPLQLPTTTIEENNTSFVCDHADATWFNQEGLLYPECSVSVVSDKTQDGDIDVPIDSDSCNDTQKIQEIQDSIETSISNAICTEHCDIEVKSECQLENSEELTNMLLTKRRRKRDLLLEEVPHKNIRHYKKKKRLNVKFQVRGRYLNETKRTEIRIKGANSTAKLGDVKFLCPIGFIPRKNRCVQCPRGTFHNSTSNICQSCDFGFYNDRLGQSVCTECPSNQSTRKMHSKTSDDCREMCPPGTRARKRKIKLPRQQKNLTIERVTLTPQCKSCPVGTFQSKFGQIRCTPCPPGYTTTKVQATSIEDCISTASEACKLDQNLCNNGKCVVANEYEFSCECFPGFLGPYCQKQLTACDSQPCFNGGTCVSEGSDFRCSCPETFSGKYCETMLEKEDFCGMKCQNEGSCLDIGENEVICACPAGFSGNLCETPTRHCDNVLCENNGTCVEADNSFKCICPKGYMGRRCNILPCDYRPCEETSVCVNLNLENTTKSSYRCVCPEGYTGPKCLDKIDYCAQSQCQNGAECVNEETSYRCKCSKLYYGGNCQFRRDTSYMLNFSRYDVNDFIRLRGFEKNLTEITACLWLQTLDNFNYGTLLSYATRYTDNAFTLTDYTGLVFYVNKQYVVTDVLLNDGYWHHICAAWKSGRGSYQIYVDGKLMRNGSDLAPYTEIGGRGYLVIGQEQDILGGRFSQSESFVGNMAYIDIWSRVLSQNEVSEHQNDCGDSILGDLYAWPEMQEHTNGNIQRLPSSFCQSCEDPQPLYNGFINLIDNKAFYSCYEGFELSSQQFAKGRKCTKTSKWEGYYEPYCKKLNCGYPGIVKNGYSIGNQYYYQDRVAYQCHDAFNMVGNPVIFCREDGKWYPEKPKCIGAQCILPVVSYGKIQIISEAAEETDSITKVDPDSQISLVCYENATLIGNSVATCLEDVAKEKHCRDCNKNIKQTMWLGHLRSNPHKNNSKKPLEEGVQVIKSAFKERIISYRLSTEETFLSIPNYFLHLEPKILRIIDQELRKHRCIKLNMELFGFYFNPSNENYDVKSFNTVFQVICNGTETKDFIDQTYTIIDKKADEFAERDLGTWDTANFSCHYNEREPKELPSWKSNCPIIRVPPAPENGYADEDSLRAAESGSTDFVLYKCRPGYKLVGQNVSSCIVDGYWTEPNISCQAVICPNPPSFSYMLLKHQEFKSDRYMFGNMVSYQCQEGYKMVGNSAVRCTILGQWSKMQAKCIRVSCGKPQVSPNTRIVGSSYLFGNTVIIACPNQASFNLTCGKDGIWDGEIDSSC